MKRNFAISTGVELSRMILLNPNHIHTPLEARSKKEKFVGRIRR